MRLNSAGGTVDVFAITPRAFTADQYRRDIAASTDLAERYGYTGLLIFTGNDTFLDPWFVAHEVLRRSTRLEPLVAVNPYYCHPYSAGKMVASLISTFRRKVWLNMVTGAITSHRDALGDNLSHAERYARLSEYIGVLQMLFKQAGLASFQGKYYALHETRLVPAIPVELSPTFMLAGQSAAATKTAQAHRAHHLRMLPPSLDPGRPANPAAMHFGIVTRQTTTSAWSAANGLFPENAENRAMLEMSMANTDSVWKHRLRRLADEPAATGFWLGPFLQLEADCPYFVGSYAEVSDLLVQFVRSGIHSIVLDIKATDEEFSHVAIAFDAAQQLLEEEELGSR